MKQSQSAIDTPIHQWTHKGDSVLLVKVLNRDGTTHRGFIWPKEGPVKPDKWSRVPDCKSGGLFGWPWGMGIGDGKDRVTAPGPARLFAPLNCGSAADSESLIHSGGAV